MTEQKHHESEFIRRRQKAREKTQFSTRALINLILVSIVLCVAFVVWADVSKDVIGLGDLAIFAIGMLLFIIFIAGIFGAILALYKRTQRNKNKDNLSVILDEYVTKDKQ